MKKAYVVPKIETITEEALLAAEIEAFASSGCGCQCLCQCTCQCKTKS